MFVDAGAHYVVLDFDNAPDCDGDLTVMATQVRSALAWVYRNAARFAGDPQRIWVSASSSGAHLAAVAATTDWQAQFGLPQDMVKGYTLCSGMYDLEAPRLSKRSSYVKFTDEMVQALSPQRHLARIHAPIVLLYGSLETPEFKRQAEEFAAALAAAGKVVELIRAEGYNHFEIAETLVCLSFEQSDAIGEHRLVEQLADQLQALLHSLWSARHEPPADVRVRGLWFFAKRGALGAPREDLRQHRWMSVAISRLLFDIERKRLDRQVWRASSQRDARG